MTFATTTVLIMVLLVFVNVVVIGVCPNDAINPFTC